MDFQILQNNYKTSILIVVKSCADDFIWLVKMQIE